MYSSDMSSEDYIRSNLDLPKTMRVESIISFGYSDEEKSSRSSIPKEDLDYHKIKSIGRIVASGRTI